jgi:hypothetical protein
MLVVAAIAAAATAFGFGLARAGSGGEPASGGFVPSGGGFLQLQEEPEAPDAQTPDAERDCPWKDGSGTDATGIEQV